MGQGGADAARRFDEIDAVIGVLLDAGGDGKDVGIENDVLWREADDFGQELVGAAADFYLAGFGVGLALFVKGHDDDSSAIGADQPGGLQELFLAFLHRD